MTSQVQIILYFLDLYIARVSITRAMSLALAVFDLLVGKHLVCCNATCSYELTHKDEVPQDLIDMTARAADDTGRMVRSHPTSGLTPDKKRQRTAMADLAERFERESDEWHKRYEDLDAQVAKRVGSKDWSRYPRSDRDLLQKLYNESSNKARAAEKLQRDIRDLDHEYPEVPAATAAAADLDHTDTLPLITN